MQPGRHLVYGTVVTRALPRYCLSYFRSKSSLSSLSGGCRPTECEAAVRICVLYLPSWASLGTHLVNGKYLGRNYVPSETQGFSNSLTMQRTFHVTEQGDPRIWGWAAHKDLGVSSSAMHKQIYLSYTDSCHEVQTYGTRGWSVIMTWKLETISKLQGNQSHVRWPGYK